MATLSHEDILNRVMETVASQVADSIKGAVMDAVKDSLSETMHTALVENEFYRHLNTEMRRGLQNIYKEITAASEPTEGTPPDSAEKTGKLFSEASEQLEAVMNTTFEATESIMAAVEGILERLQDVSQLLLSLRDSAPQNATERLENHRLAMEEAMTSIMTTLSFQDLTGQRLKKVVKALSDIQESIFEMYVSSGLMIKSREEQPDKALEDIARESQDKLKEIKEIRGSELKGPCEGTSQANVDSLLADLGL